MCEGKKIKLIAERLKVTTREKKKIKGINVSQEAVYFKI